MKKRELRKAAYEAIVKQNKNHQEVFDELRQASKINSDELADEISKIPSVSKFNRNKGIRSVYLGFLILIIVLRILGIIGMQASILNSPAILILVLILGIIVPAVGVYGDLVRKVDIYRSVGILLILAIIRSLRSELFEDSWNLLVLLPFLIAAILAFYIPTKLKTRYQKKTVKTEVEGKVMTKVEYNFDESNHAIDSEILDDAF